MLTAFDSDVHRENADVRWVGFHPPLFIEGSATHLVLKTLFGSLYAVVTTGLTGDSSYLPLLVVVDHSVV
jgi:hypothetical protein